MSLTIDFLLGLLAGFAAQLFVWWVVRRWKKRRAALEIVEIRGPKPLPRTHDPYRP